jgi:neutral ceramidase
LKKILKWVLGIVSTLLVLVLVLFTTVDHTPYKQMPYYASMMKALDTFHVDVQHKKGDTLRAAWYKVALTPHVFPHPLAGYGLRKKAVSVNDTTFVRTFIFDNAKTRVAYVSLDLLIFPPALKDRVRAELETTYNLKVFLTATHTHSAPGGWEPKIAGRILAGEYSDEYVALLFNAIDECISKAIPRLQKVEQAYIRISAPEAVQNRLKGADAPKDSFIRGIKFRNKSGEEACLFTFAAHANCLNSDVDYVSADYPGIVSAELEKRKWASFVSYAAGAVGSHAPTFETILDGKLRADTVSSILVEKLQETKAAYAYTNQLYYHRLPLFLRDAHLRVEKDIRIRPWVFNTILGKDIPDIQIIEIGETVLLGMPCDYSGELMPPLEKICADNQSNFMLSGFNGGYIGYITDDACYDWDRGETMDMNWFGPYNAAYLTEVNTVILKKVLTGE